MLAGFAFRSCGRSRDGSGDGAASRAAHAGRRSLHAVDGIARAARDATPTPLPDSNFTVSRGIGILEDDGASWWPGITRTIQAPATFRATPTANNTFTLRRVDDQFDDPTGGRILYDGALRPIVGYVDANYERYNLTTPLTYAGKQYTQLSISKWGAVAFGNADSTQVNYDPTVVSNMFRIPMVAVWYEMFSYTSGSKIIAKQKSDSVVITWQNLISRHSTTPVTFQVEFFNSGEIQLSYQSLPVDHGLVGFSTADERYTRQTSNGASNPDLPLHMQVDQAYFDDYGSGVIGGITLKLKGAIPSPVPAGEAYRYMLVLNNTDVVGIYVSGTSASVSIGTTRIPDFPSAQMSSWELKRNGDTLSLRFPASSLDSFLSQSGFNTWWIKVTRFGGAGFVERTATPILPLTFSVRRSYLPGSIGESTEVPAIIYHYIPGVLDTDRIRASISTYLANRGQNVSSFRFFPLFYEDGLRHTNYAGTYPRSKSVTGIGTIPARTDCTACFGAEFSPAGESLGNEATTQVALTHELVHEFGFYADFRDLDGTVKGTWRDAGIPCTGGAHPNNGLVNTSMFGDPQRLIPTISVMGGSVTGTFQLNAARYGMSRLEMYLMGLAGPAEVTPMKFVYNGTTSTITIDQVISALGPRSPAYTPGSITYFRVPNFVVRRKGEAVSDAQLEQLQKMLWRWQTRFAQESGGRARANQTLDGACSYTLSANDANAPLGGGAGSFDVLTTSGCTWTATSNASWIAVSGGGSGNGDGHVSYSVAPNNTASSRSGTITIAGQPLTIHQIVSVKRRSTKK